ncbi:MAG: GIY-YIG nuclease family protein [bacterium]|nr:GIY-YIG nuclease family protein [bacterium]
MPYSVYIVENPAGRLYVGQTEDLARRIEQHNDPAHNPKKFTTRHAGPWTLVWHEEYADRASAMARERSIKGMKSSRWIREHLLRR